MTYIFQCISRFVRENSKRIGLDIVDVSHGNEMEKEKDGSSISALANKGNEQA